MKYVIYRPNREMEVFEGYDHHVGSNGCLEIVDNRKSIVFAPGEWSIATVEVEDE